MPRANASVASCLSISGLSSTRIVMATSLTHLLSDGCRQKSIQGRSAEVMSYCGLTAARFRCAQFLGRSGSWNQYAPEGGNNRQTWRQEFAHVFSGLRGGEAKKRLTKSGGTSRLSTGPQLSCLTSGVHSTRLFLGFPGFLPRVYKQRLLNSFPTRNKFSSLSCYRSARW
jgi:hypothetical protein